MEDEEEKLIFDIFILCFAPKIFKLQIQFSPCFTIKWKIMFIISRIFIEQDLSELIDSGQILEWQVLLKERRKVAKVEPRASWPQAKSADHKT